MIFYQLNAVANLLHNFCKQTAEIVTNLDLVGAQFLDKFLKRRRQLRNRCHFGHMRTSLQGVQRAL